MTGDQAGEDAGSAPVEPVQSVGDACHGTGPAAGRLPPVREATFAQRYTPRTPRSLWSQRNNGIATRLIAEGRMRPRGHAEIEQAQAAGRWMAPHPDEVLADTATPRRSSGT